MHYFQSTLPSYKPSSSLKKPALAASQPPVKSAPEKKPEPEPESDFDDDDYSLDDESDGGGKGGYKPSGARAAVDDIDDLDAGLFGSIGAKKLPNQQK